MFRGRRYLERPTQKQKESYKNHEQKAIAGGEVDNSRVAAGRWKWRERS